MEDGLGQIATEMFVADPVPDAHDGPLENGMQALGRIDVSAQTATVHRRGRILQQNG